MAKPPTQSAFTVVELLVVIAIILVLAKLILVTSGYVQTKGKRARAEAEIAALSTALENYKADNGIYPTDNANGTTNTLDARTMFNPAAPQYAAASVFLYKELSGDPIGNRDPDRQVVFPFQTEHALAERPDATSQRHRGSIWPQLRLFNSPSG